MAARIAPVLDAALAVSVRCIRRHLASVRALWDVLPLPERRPWVWGLQIAGLISVLSALLFDQRLAERMSGKPDGLHRVLATLSEAGDSVWYLVPIAIVGPALWFHARRTADAAAARLCRWGATYLGFVFAAIAISGLSVNVIKCLTGRARPRVYFGDGFSGLSPPGLDSDFQSFPSGHASTTVALALCLAIVLPRFRVHLLIAGIGLALTRTAVNAHYLSDVIAGGAVSVLTVLLLRNYCAQRGLVFAKPVGGAPPLAPEGRFLQRRCMRAAHAAAAALRAAAGSLRR